MAVWIDKDPARRFCGALLVMNMGMDEWASSRPPAEYIETLAGAINFAHADGYAVVYVFDRGISMPPEDLEWMEDMDFCRLSRTLGMPALSFSLGIAQREREFAALAYAARYQEDMVIEGPISLVGACLLDQERVLMPPTRLV